jgi:hypothetical protein
MHTASCVLAQSWNNNEQHDNMTKWNNQIIESAQSLLHGVVMGPGQHVSWQSRGYECYDVRLRCLPSELREDLITLQEAVSADPRK